MKIPRARTCIRHLHPYIPGEQPKVGGMIKLNTNENPYPPSPRVMKAIQKELNEGLRLYPDPMSERFRRKIASIYRFRINQIIAGNGSDEILTLCLRAFVEKGQGVQFPRPSYSLYPVLAQIQDGRVWEVPFERGFHLNIRKLDPRASLTFVANPNAPTGTVTSEQELWRLARRLKGVLVVDEAYADFASANALKLARREGNVLVTRSLSKSFSLAGMRLGFAVGSEALIKELFKVKDSYNLDRLAQVAGEAALSDMPYHRRMVDRVIRTREKVRATLIRCGWECLPSSTNFLFVKPSKGTAWEWLKWFRRKKILVRWFPSKETKDYLRITIGTESEMNHLLRLVLQRSCRT